MKTFNYESRNVWYRNCYFDIGKYKNGKMKLDIYGYVENDKNISHISNATVEVIGNLNENQVVIDNENNTNLISFLLDLGIIKGIYKRISTGANKLPVVDLDLEKLYEYSYNFEELAKVS